ncbi:MAG: hypothetical protein IID45_10245 [Planctomycetes bacterium]|nr:hypothetical protein [Planctomycetota bacterium]
MDATNSPTLDEIRIECLLIQESWTEEERAVRAGLASDVESARRLTEWTAPIIRTAGGRESLRGVPF